MDFKYLSEKDTMVYILPFALVPHHFSSNEIEENLGQVKGSALHEVIQDELMSIGQEVL